MWNVIERKLKSGKIAYIAQVRRRGAKSVNRSHATRSDAEDFARERDEEIRKMLASSEGGLSAQSFYRERFHDAIALFVAQEELCGDHKYSLLRVREFFPNVTLAGLKPSVVQGYVDFMLKTNSRLGRPFKKNTMRKHLSAMAQVYKWRAKQYDLDVRTNIFGGLQGMKNSDEKRTRRLATHEERALFAVYRSMGPRGYTWRLLIKLALETGARQQEFFKSTWSEFDFESRVWNMPAEHTKCKTERGVPLSKRAFRCLRALRKLHGGSQPGPFAALLSCGNLRSTFRDQLRRAGIVGFRFHDLRHESISRIVRQKKRLRVFEIMKFVGHSNSAMLARYSNLRADELVDAME